jgi:hypothetical protein
MSQRYGIFVHARVCFSKKRRSCSYAVAYTPVVLRLLIRLRLVREKKIFGCHIGCRKGFSDTNKKQITEPVKKLRDEYNDID